MGVPKLPEAGGGVSGDWWPKRGNTYAENGDFLDGRHRVVVALCDLSVGEIR